MGTGKPLVSILLAVYEPRMDWLRELLCSLNAQTYRNLRLYVRDDCSPTVPFDAIQSCVRACITAFPYEISRNDRNRGSNITFETLTREAEGDCFAYCDQDDVWLPEKIAVLQQAIAETGALLACSDMYIIDRNGAVTADSITKVRRHHVFMSGEGLAEKLLFRNFVVGCSTLLHAETARTSVPFCPYMVHDHYLALRCADAGALYSVKKPLLCYRIHGGNQTSMMAGVHDRESYIDVRVSDLVRRLDWLWSNIPCSEKLSASLESGLVWARARENTLRGVRGAWKTVWKYRTCGLLPSLFEILAPALPDKLFMLVIEMIKRNQL